MENIQNGPGNGSFCQCFSLSNEQTIVCQAEACDEEEDFLNFRPGLSALPSPPLSVHVCVQLLGVTPPTGDYGARSRTRHSPFPDTS